MAIEELRIQLPPTSTAPGLARQIVLDMNPPPDVVDDMMLVVSELVTNAVKHGAPPVELTVRSSTEGVTLEVYDAAAGEPTVRTLERLDAPGGGRGLRLVSEVAADWGVHTGPVGKCVWATLACPTASTSPWTIPSANATNDSDPTFRREQAAVSR